MALLHPNTAPKGSPGGDSSAREQEPAREYERRLEGLRQKEARQKRMDASLGYLMVFLLLAGLAFVIWILTVRTRLIAWVAIPAVLLVIFGVIHQRVIRALRETTRAIAFYERGLARLRGEWAGNGEPGEQFANPNHPYARDLDLFGKGSLFELLCGSRTCEGQETLAIWLLAPASPEEARLRQSAVEDLRNRLDFREAMAVAGEDVRSEVKPGLLAAWGEKNAQPVPGAMRIALFVLSALWIFGLGAWAKWGAWQIVFFATVINSGVSYKFRELSERSAGAIEGAAGDLRLHAQVLGRLEREPFSAPKLSALQAAFRSGGLPASICIARLNRRVEFLISSRNLVIETLDRFVLWSLQWGLSIEAWRNKHGVSVRRWLDAAGEIEALSDLAAYAFEHPSDPFPEFTNEEPWFEAEGLAHPLLPESRAVRNDLKLSPEFRLMMISGPNMAGKSTFVRAVGVNAVLAQCGAPVRARRLRISRLAVGASVCVLDSLQGGISRFYAEIARLKLIVDMTRGESPVLFLLDELLQGTNSHDRRIGAEAIARRLLERGAVGLITTHDLALAEIAESLRPRASNFHFEDRLESRKLIFDYRLSPGPVHTSNALDLMRSIGLEV